MGVKLKRVNGIEYDRIYAVTNNSMELKRIILHDEYALWRVNATYNKKEKPCSYYVIEKTRTKAKTKFLTKLPWLNIIWSISPLNYEERKSALGKPFKYIIF
jgi:hypothetical protein